MNITLFPLIIALAASSAPALSSPISAGVRAPAFDSSGTPVLLEYGRPLTPSSTEQFQVVPGAFCQIYPLSNHNLIVWEGHGTAAPPFTPPFSDFWIFACTAIPSGYGDEELTIFSSPVL